MRTLFNIFIIIIAYSAVFFSFACSANQNEEFSVADYKDWKEIDNDHFQFKIPSDMKEEKVQVKDTEIWKFSNEEIILNITYGSNISPLERLKNQIKTQPDYLDYSDGEIYADGRSGFYCIYISSVEKDKMAQEYKGKKNISLIYFDKIINNDKLLFSVAGSSPEANHTAKMIFQSIKFKVSQSQNQIQN